MEEKTVSDYAQDLDHVRQKTLHQLPRQTAVVAFLDSFLHALFPDHFAIPSQTLQGTEENLTHLRSTFDAAITSVLTNTQDRASLCRDLLKTLPEMYTLVYEDAQAICSGDPAAKGIDEVIVAYPGFFAIAVHRIAHWLHTRGVPLVPRIMTEYAHQRTGVDIHPGATIGRRFVIDHGTGIVIGETSHIHDDVKLYQGVTLGGLSIDKSMADTKRHPTIESNVVIYANATILGGSTVIGTGSTIGGNVWLTSSVPAHSRVYHKAEFVIKSGSEG